MGGAFDAMSGRFKLDLFLYFVEIYDIDDFEPVRQQLYLIAEFEAKHSKKK